MCSGLSTFFSLPILPSLKITPDQVDKLFFKQFIDYQAMNMLVSVNSGIKETRRHILFAGDNFVGDRFMYVSALWGVRKSSSCEGSRQRRRIRE